MIQPSSPHRSYSASTELWLQLGDRRIELSQIGPDFVMPREPLELARGSEAELHTTVDDHERVQLVRFPRGVTPDDQDAAIEVVRRVETDD
jgi:hypothetical protein